MDAEARRAALQKRARARRRRERPAEPGTPGDARHRPATMSRLGITPQAVDDALYDAFGQRQVSTMFTQLNQYRVVLEVDPSFQKSPRRPRRTSTCAARPARRSRSRAFTPHRGVARRRSPSTTRASSRSVTVSFNLAPGASLGEAVRAIEAREAGRSDCPRASRPGSRERPRAFQASLANAPLLILAALVTVYILLGRPLRELHPPGHDPLDAALRRRGRAPVADDLPHGLQRHRAHRHHPAHRHRQEERDHDDRLRARRRAQGGQGAPRRDLPGLPAALPPDPDDDDRRAARAASRSPSAAASAPSSAGRSASRSSAASSSRRSSRSTRRPVIYLAFDRLARRVASRRASRAAAPVPRVAESR